MSGELSLRGVLKGHGGWVTSIATPDENNEMILTASRDKSVICWSITRGEGEGGANSEYGSARRALRGYVISKIFLFKFLLPILDTPTTLKTLSSPKMDISLSPLPGITPSASGI
jgi:WD40 repeat protein